MNSLTYNLPLAQAARVVEQPTYEWSRLEMLADRPGLTAVVVLVAFALVALVGGLYWREARTVSGPKALLLTLLRLVALAGLATFFMGIERRMNREVVEPSRVVVIADTSLSMALPAGEDASDGTRSEAVIEMLAQSPLLAALSKVHQVEIVGFDESSRSLARITQLPPNNESSTPVDSDAATIDPTSNLPDQLLPTGKQSQLGTALDTTLKQYRTLPLAGVVMVTDGGQNTGPDPLPLATQGREAGAVLHTVGFGPLTLPMNVTVRDMLAPQRAFPGDDMTITALIQLQSLGGETVDVVLLRRVAGVEGAASNESVNELVDTQTVSVAEDEEIASLRFETRVDEPGRYEFEVRVEPLANERNVEDNARVATVEVIEQQTRVLIYAGAASRDYQFLRNQLKRDKSFTVDVLLDTGSEGVSQDANEVLAEFPATAEALLVYDAIVAFDPRWSSLDAARLELLERWVSKQAGGLVVVPGPVNASAFGSDSLPRTLRDLYPVRVGDTWQATAERTASRDKPQRLEFSRAGLEAEFLWLADTADESFDNWGEFAGVYGAQETGEPKPGATLYASATDDVAAPMGATPYLVGQYFGAGQVFYVGSGESWRLRSVDTDYFDLFWTKLLRHVSQGRLLQSSQRAKLLVGQDRYQVGDTIDVRAVVTTASLDPFVAESVDVTLLEPSGDVRTISLASDTSDTGNFAGEYRARQAGDYKLSLAVPDSDETVEREITVVFPQLEVRQVVQNAALLEQLATLGGGHYYTDAESVLAGGAEFLPLAESIPSREEARIVPGAIDLEYSRRLSMILLGVITLALASEWVVRRLNYLA